MEQGERRQRGEERAQREMIQNAQKIQPCSENNSALKHRGVCDTTEKTESSRRHVCVRVRQTQGLDVWKERCFTLAIQQALPGAAALACFCGATPELSPTFPPGEGSCSQLHTSASTKKVHRALSVHVMLPPPPTPPTFL